LIKTGPVLLGRLIKLTNSVLFFGGRDEVLALSSDIMQLGLKMVLDLAVEDNMKQIAFFHHEPTCVDFKLTDIFRQTEKYLKLVAPKYELKMFLSYEGLSVDLFNESS
jgi:HD-like signal output (HDOD) protein